MYAPPNLAYKITQNARAPSVVFLGQLVERFMYYKYKAGQVVDTQAIIIRSTIEMPRIYR